MHSPYKLLHDQPKFQFQTTVHIRGRDTPNEHGQTRLSAMLKKAVIPSGVQQFSQVCRRFQQCI